jgi:hypothetical protein
VPAAGGAAPVDGALESDDNYGMNKNEPTPIPSEIMADLEAVCRQAATGSVTDPELLQRVRTRAEAARQENLARFGVQEIGVQIIREMRDEG